MSSYEQELVRLAHQGSRRMEAMGKKTARLGVCDDAGNWTLPDEDRAHFLEVTLENDQTISAMNLGVPEIAGLYVIVEQDYASGEMLITGIDPVRAADFMPPTGALNPVAKHDHRIGGGLDDPVEERRFVPGLVHAPDDQTQSVMVQPFRYWRNGQSLLCAGGRVSLASVWPGTTNTRAWIVVHFDPEDGSLSATKGAEVSAVTLMTEDMIDDIDLDGAFPLGALWVNASDTGVNDERRFAKNMRAFFQFGADAGSAARGVSTITERFQVSKVLWKKTLGSSGSFDTHDSPDEGSTDLSGYDHLIVRVYNVRSAAAVTTDTLYMLFNNDTTAANYRSQQLSGVSASAAASVADTPRVAGAPGASGTADYVSLIEVFIANYAGSKFKVARSHNVHRDAATTEAVRQWMLHWESTSAISRIQVRTDNDPTDLLTAGSVMEVIGVKSTSLVTGVSGGGAASVRAATTADITLSGAQTIDGVSVVAGDLVLVKDQADASENGLYVAASGAWERSSTDLAAAMLVTVQEGTLNGDSVWILTTDDPFVVDTDDLNFKQIGTRHSTANVSNPPTDAELDAAFGTPAQVGAGFRATLDDNGGGSNFYFVASDGANWWTVAGTKAV